MVIYYITVEAPLRAGSHYDAKRELIHNCVNTLAHAEIEKYSISAYDASYCETALTVPLLFMPRQNKL